jgi:hypothetical protein
MKADEEIYNLIRSMSKSGRPVLLAKVKEVDEAKGLCTCSPTINDDVEFYDVRLRSLGDEKNGLYIYPKLESLVLIEAINEADKHILKYGEIAKIEYKSASNSLLIDSENDEIIFNGGTNGGLIKINDLISKINTLETDINALKTVFSSWVVSVGDGGTALKGTAATWAAQQITPTTANDLKNDKIKH